MILLYLSYTLPLLYLYAYVKLTLLFIYRIRYHDDQKIKLTRLAPICLLFNIQC